MEICRWVVLRGALLCAGLLCAGPSAAHELWIAPSTYRAVRGDTATVRVYVGTGFRGALKPYAPSRVGRFALRTTRELDLTRAARNGDLVMARFVVADEGGSMVSYESRFAHVDLPAAEFDAYLALEGLDVVRTARQRSSSSGPARERYARCAKSWIAGSDVTRLTRPSGLTYELTPLTDPSTTSTLTVRATFRGQPLAGALVRAWMRPLMQGARPFDAAARDSVPPAAQDRTDASGLVTLSLPGGGSREWLMSSVHMIASADREDADWESYWASLTFARTTK